MSRRTTQASPARIAAVEVLTRLAEAYPDLPLVGPDVAGLDARDARLAVAIHRTVVQRWLTLRSILNTFLRQRLEQLEPPLQAVLLAGAAQLVFMARIPAYAVIDESVAQAKRRVRPGAGGLVNAVLRKVGGCVVDREVQGRWEPAADGVPWEQGAIYFDRPVVPDPQHLDAHLAAATSHPMELTRDWLERFDRETAIALLRHNTEPAPTIVRAPDVFELDPALVDPHEEEGFAVWRGDHEALTQWLSEDKRRWVQDPTSARPVAATAELSPKLMVDYCAGLGTKSRQLAELHPDATVVATDRDERRLRELHRVFADSPNVRICRPDEVLEYRGQCDLVLLDVPCSNTGVLARRLEARYRYSGDEVAELAELQRQIIQHVAPLPRREGDRVVGRLLYSTCSLTMAENEQQAAWAGATLNLSYEKGELKLPGGRGHTYHDGGYYALLGPR